MKKLITAILILSFFSCFSQKSLVFDDFQLNDKMRLIGMYPHYDEKKTYESYNFLIEDSKIIDSISKVIVKGKEVMNQSTRQEFTIWLYNGDEKVKSWSFDPKYKFIRINGKSYEFDASQILRLTKKYGFRYSLEKRFYSTQQGFDKEYEEIKNNPNLLFVYKPNFKFEGTFEIAYPKTGKFRHPKAISEYLDKKIGKFRTTKQYRAYYIANEFNRKNPNQYTMTVESDLGLFELFEDKKGQKGQWKPKEYSAYIFLKN